MQSGAAMEMQQVRYFLSLAQHLNFTRAAEECNISQPALTRAVQALEAELGGELIRRERRSSHLTDLGRRMLPFLQQCYEGAMGAKALARTVTSEDLAPLSIAVSHTIPIDLIMQPLAEVFRCIPGLQLNLLHGLGRDIPELLREGGADMGVAGPIGSSADRLDVWPLYEEGFVAFAPANHPLAAEAEVSLAQLKSLPVFTQLGCENRDELVAWLRSGEIAEERLHVVTTQDQIRSALQARLGVAIVPESLPRPDGVVSRPLAGFTARRRVSAYTITGRMRPPTVNLLLNLLRVEGDLRFDPGRP